MLEIERNFIVDTVPPEIPRGERCIVHQLYLATGIEEVRVRKLVFADREEYYIGYKYGKGEIREEFERPITKESYLQNGDVRGFYFFSTQTVQLPSHP